MTRGRRFGAVVLTCVAAVAFASSAGATVFYTYDDLGRVTSITYDDGKRVTYSYDAAGNRTQHVVEQTANLPPVAVNDQIDVELSLGNTGIGYLLTNDSDPNGDVLIIQSTTTPTLGTVSIGGGGSYVTYTYTASYALAPTTDSFNYTVSDGRGGTASATVTVSIQNTPPPPPCDPLIEFCEIE